MDQSLVKQIAEMWEMAASPVRPSPATVDAFRASLPTGNGWRGLVQGATPEVVDMMVAHDAERVVSMDLHLETIEAMRVLGTQDWSGVETVVGDWMEDRPEYRSAFDIVVCDGGALFVPFPNGWRQMYENTYRQLVPGGKTVFRTWVEPPDAPSFEELYDQALARFERKRQGLGPAEQADLFVQFVSEAKGAALVGTVDENGAVVEERMWPAWHHLETDLRARFGEGAFQAVVWALFERTNPVGEEGAHLVAAPGEALFRPVLEEVGFTVDVMTLDEPETPAWNVVVTASKP